MTEQTAERLGAQGVAMVDAPVSGAQWGAQEANLVFMAGASVSELARWVEQQSGVAITPGASAPPKSKPASTTKTVKTVKTKKP